MTADEVFIFVDIPCYACAEERAKRAAEWEEWLQRHREYPAGQPTSADDPRPIAPDDVECWTCGGPQGGRGYLRVRRSLAWLMKALGTEGVDDDEEAK